MYHIFHSKKTARVYDIFKSFKQHQPRWSDMDINEKRRLVQASVRSGREKALLMAGIAREEHGN